MASAVCRVVTVLVLVHGLIHLLGAAKGLGWAEVAQLRKPIGTFGGVAWLVGAIVVIAAAAALAAGIGWWWVAAAVAAVVSQAVIVTSWSDAKWGTVANIVLLLAAGYGFASVGPVSFQAEWRERADAAIAQSTSAGDLVTEADLASLPEPVAAYVRSCGAVGKPHITNLYADIHGRIRGGPDEAWMTFTGRQLNTYGPSPQRLFLIDASMRGLPVDVLHVFAADSATMRARVLSLVPIVDAAGADMDRGETVTLFNDLVVFAPAALVDAPIRWSPIDEQRVRGTFTNGAQTVAAELVFNADHELVDFISDDRLRASADGTSFTRQRWSTPIHAYQDLRGRRVAVVGEGRWHAPAPEGEFSYIEFHVDDLWYNVRPIRLAAEARPRVLPLGELEVAPVAAPLRVAQDVEQLRPGRHQ
jgi:hypothetical protein